jgi:hypothetical protein
VKGRLDIHDAHETMAQAGLITEHGPQGALANVATHTLERPHVSLNPFDGDHPPNTRTLANRTGFSIVL